MLIRTCGFVQQHEFRSQDGDIAIRLNEDSFDRGPDARIAPKDEGIHDALVQQHFNILMFTRYPIQKQIDRPTTSDTPWTWQLAQQMKDVLRFRELCHASMIETGIGDRERFLLLDTEL